MNTELEIVWKLLSALGVGFLSAPNGVGMAERKMKVIVLPASEHLVLSDYSVG
ncbi:MAG: hypothetical protein U5K71_15630 [Gracilimonas sp.]|nr:hypothetical protein [Gracilimonas sp.]